MPRVEKFPKPDIAKKLYMESKFYSWMEFCVEMGWPHRQVRQKYPVKLWIKEKIDAHSSDLATDIEGMMQDRATTWYQEVNNTLKVYPNAIDGVLNLLKLRTKEYLELAIQDQNKKVKAGEGKFSKVSDGALRHLAQSMKAVTEAKFQSLMLTDLAIKQIETNPEGSGRIVFEIKGGSTPENIEKIMEEWNDK